MREIKNLINLTKEEYTYYTYNDGSLNVLENLEDMLYVFETNDDKELYICDLINSIADSYVSIYNYQIWKDAAMIPDWIEEAIEEYGGLMGGNLLNTFQYGIYRYNELGLYENLEELIFNYAILYLDSDIYNYEEKHIQEKILKLTNNDIKDAVSNIDNNSTFEDITIAMDNLIERLKTEEEE